MQKDKIHNDCDFSFGLQLPSSPFLGSTQTLNHDPGVLNMMKQSTLFQS